MDVPSILVCCETFKGTLDSTKVCRAVAEGLRCVDPRCSIVEVPMTDGGLGYLNAMHVCLQDRGFRRVKVKNVCGPDCRRIEAEYGVFEGEAGSPTAVVEMARAAGIDLVPPEQLNPMVHSSYGVGQLLRHAAEESQCRTIYLGIGGSCTNDAGIPALQGLGAVAVETMDGKVWGIDSTPMTAAEVMNMKDIEFNFTPASGATDTPGSDVFHDVEIFLVCDITNPFTGPTGATYIFGPQKGARTEVQRAELETGMLKVKDAVERRFGIDLNNYPGSGAAGGMAGLFSVAFPRARTVAGCDMFDALANLGAKVATSDWVFTGEGKFDAQTLDGKSGSKVMALCRQHKKPLTVVCGASDVEASVLSGEAGFSVVQLLDRHSLNDALTRAFDCIVDSVADYWRQRTTPMSKENPDSSVNVPEA